MPIPDEWFDDEPTPRTPEEMDRAYGGKEAREKFLEKFAASLKKKEPDEDETIETEDKFLPRRR
jgi:hypothetical protein